MQRTAARPKVMVSADGRGVVGHAGTRLLTDVAEVTGLAAGFVEGWRRCGAGRLVTSRAGSRSMWR
jgi:hypothetical protein